jgi:hypothetical protein
MVDYSEDFLARIDTPVLNNFSMSFFMDLVFDVSHLKQFIGRTKDLKPYKVARVVFNTCFIRLEFNQRHGPMLEVRCDRIDWQVDSMTLTCGRLSPFFSHIERLDLVADSSLLEPQGINDFESTQFFELFQPFIAIRSLHVSLSRVVLIAPALRELVGERATEVLPNLRDLFLEGSAIPKTVMEAIQPFVTARRLSGQPVAVHHWDGW